MIEILSEELTQSRELNVKLKNALTRLSTSIDGKIEYEMEELKMETSSRLHYEYTLESSIKSLKMRKTKE